MHIIQVIKKCFEDRKNFTGIDKENRYHIYISEQNDANVLRIIKNGHMIEIPFDNVKWK